MFIIIAAVFVFTKEQTKLKFKGFIEAEIEVMTFEELLNNEPATLAEVKILNELGRNKAKKLKGYQEVNGNSSTFFEAEVLHNYSDTFELDKKIILVQFGTHEWQLQGDPLYEKGDKLLMVLSKSKIMNFCGSYGGSNGAFYITEENGEKYINKTIGGFTDINIKGVYINENEKELIKKESKENPIHFTQRFKLKEFVDEFNREYKEKVK
jgi:hypothetical protein